jgi:hypothetical protein
MPLGLRWFIHIERTKSEKMQKNVFARMERTRKMGRLRKKWGHEIEDLKVIRIINGHRVTRKRKEWTRVLL